MKQPFFIRFPSIENTYREETMARIRAALPADTQWVATEKLHGANFSIVVTEDDIRVCSRNQMLPRDTNFNGVRTILPRLEASARSLFDACGDSVKQLTIYGELVGGAYPHPDVPKNPNVSRIQKGVFYSPNVEFFAFAGIRTFHVPARSYGAEPGLLHTFRRYGFNTAPVVSWGMLGDVLKTSNEFQTRVPAQLGLPPIDGNICEGLVLQPYKAQYIDGYLVILKSKNERFKEVQTKPKRERSPDTPHSIECDITLGLADDYTTSQRLNNVLSKTDLALSRETIGHFIKELSQDVQAALESDFSVAWNALPKEEQKIVRKHINTLAAALVRRIA